MAGELNITVPEFNGSFLGEFARSAVGPDIATIITIIKAAGIVFIIYMAILIVRSIIRIKTARNIASIENHVVAIDKKLDLLLKRKK